MLWMCRWPNGEVSITVAQDAKEAAEILDEIGDTDRAEFTALPKDTRFYVTYTPDADEVLEHAAYWTVAGDIPEDIDQLLPDENEALQRFEAACQQAKSESES